MELFQPKRQLTYVLSFLKKNYIYLSKAKIWEKQQFLDPFLAPPFSPIAL